MNNSRVAVLARRPPPSEPEAWSSGAKGRWLGGEGRTAEVEEAVVTDLNARFSILHACNSSSLIWAQ